MNGKQRSAISRREFARRAALVSAASFVPASSVPIHASVETAAAWPAEDEPQLSTESRADAEARYQAIITTYSGRFNEDQKKDLQRLSLAAQPSLDRLRAYAVENADSPALYLKPLVEREKKPEAKSSSNTTSQTAKRP